MRSGKPALAVIAIAVTGCAAQPTPQGAGCILPDEKRMLVAELFFGRLIPERAPLSEAEWRAFAAEAITPNFLDGFTVFDAEGQWRNPATGTVVREPTRVVLVAAPRAPDL